MYVQVINNYASIYQIDRLYRDNPQISFPSELSDDILALFNIFSLTATEPPEYNNLYQELVEGQPALIDNKWTQTWTLVDKSLESIEFIINQKRSNMRLSFSQLIIGLVTEGWITVEEGRAWRDRISLPAAVINLIQTLPEEQKFAAETKAIAFTEALRLDSIVIALGQAEGRTPEDLDNFFNKYSQI
jgi:hypothetical protein